MMYCHDASAQPGEVSHVSSLQISHLEVHLGWMLDADIFRLPFLFTYTKTFCFIKTERALHLKRAVYIRKVLQSLYFFFSLSCKEVGRTGMGSISCLLNEEENCHEASSSYSAMTVMIFAIFFFFLKLFSNKTWRDCLVHAFSIHGYCYSCLILLGHCIIKLKSVYNIYCGVAKLYITYPT